MTGTDLQAEIEKAIQLLEEDIAAAVAEERAAVVALLRESQRMYQMHRSPGAESLVRYLADIIERGEHRREEK
jgi:N-methylhydantoinase B/oxoprolinase/acetone carboxylase alpha subunit